MPLVLLLIRLSVFLVMLVWTLDKVVNPDHAGRVYEKFYFIPGMGPTALSIVAGLELLLILGFVIGFAKRFTYGAMLLFHAVSTLSSMPCTWSPSTICSFSPRGRCWRPVSPSTSFAMMTPCVFLAAGVGGSWILDT